MFAGSCNSRCPCSWPSGSSSARCSSSKSTAVIILFFIVPSWILPMQRALLAAAVESCRAPPVAHDPAQYFYWNEITGAKQWEDPGGVPYEDEAGIPFWLGPAGERLSEDPNSHTYAWVEFFSEDLQRTYYFNQVTKESTWQKPADLAWRRVLIMCS